MNLRLNKCGLIAAGLALAVFAPAARAANVRQTFFVPLPEDEMQISLNAIDAHRGNIGDEMRSAIPSMAAPDGAIVECHAGTPMFPLAKFSLVCRHPARRENGISRPVRRGS